MILEKIEKEIKRHSASSNLIRREKENFRNGARWLGLRTPITRKIATESFQSIRSYPKNEILILCEELLEEGYYEHKIIAFNWAHRLKKNYEPKDFQVFSRWVEKYIVDWDDCDDFCTHALGEFLLQYPEFLPKVKRWTKSSEWQRRRVAAVSLIYPVRKNKFLKESLATCQALLKDDHDLVQKGYGWLLKEASRCNQDEVFRFVMKNRSRMPRVALRYAVEKMHINLEKRR